MISTHPSVTRMYFEEEYSLSGRAFRFITLPLPYLRTQNTRQETIG